jgi:hypothetical protein
LGIVEVDASEVNRVFEVRDLYENEKQMMAQKGIWEEKCPVPLKRLKMVEFSYWYLEKDSNNWHFRDQQKHDGKIVVLDAVAGHVCDIFKELYEIKFPIHKACPIENYNGDDEASMADNNSSSFNYREITGGGLSSIHSYGLAIDINPVQNPYASFLENKDIQGVGNTKILPLSGRDYINRTNLRLGMIENAKENVVEIFKNHGFPVWGGRWNTPIDWQHFQTHRSTAQLLGAMAPDDASILFNMYVKNSNLLESVDIKNNEFVRLYHANPKKFMEILDERFLQMNAEDAGALMTD